MIRVFVAWLCLVLIATAGFAYVKHRPIIDGKIGFTSPMYLGTPSTEVLSNKSPTATITISTSGAGNTLNGDCFITVDGYNNPAIATANKISGGAVGAILVIQTEVASQDVGITEAGTGANIILGAAYRVLSDPADVLILQQYKTGYWREIYYSDNN